MKKKDKEGWINSMFSKFGHIDFVRTWITTRSGYVRVLGMYTVRVYQPVTSRISAVRAFSPS